MEEEKKQSLPEAPASATMKVKSPNGFEYLFTMRDESSRSLLFKMKTMEEHFMNNGFTAIAQGNGFSKPVVPTKPCTFHPGEVMKEKINKTTGEKYYSHTRGVYPSLQYCNGFGFPGDRKTQEYPERDINEY